MSNKITNPRGTSDILPQQAPVWEALESRARTLLKTYGYREVRTPVFENVALFKRSLGESTEVVNKQLLEVKGRTSDVRRQTSDEDDAPFALRPEGTAPVVRLYDQNDLGREEFIAKLFYIAPMFRGERPQKGRLRQFHQIGAEAIGRGADHPLLDAEMIILAVEVLKDFGLEGFKVKLNSLGSQDDKARFAAWLREALKDKVGSLSEECQAQYERNVFRLLDSKDPACRKLIASLDISTNHLSSEGLDYFNAVRAALDQAGVAYEVSSQLVRGLDYYTHTVFEITYEGLGAQDAIGAGGRYNGLIEQLGGGDRRIPGPTGAIGFALGLERIILALEEQGNLPQVPRALDAFIVLGRQEDEAVAFALLQELRQAGIASDMDLGRGRAFKKQFDLANKVGARFVLILGEDELAKGVVGLKDMHSGEQRAIAREQVIGELQGKL